MTNAQQNELRYMYFRMIIQSRNTGDASPLFPYIAEDCIWGGAKGKENVIASLQQINVNYRHDSTLVQLGPMPKPLQCTSNEGRPIRLSLWYEAGEICMYDVTQHNTLLFRLELAEDGRISQFYGTMPAFFSFYEIPQSDESQFGEVK